MIDILKGDIEATYWTVNDKGLETSNNFIHFQNIPYSEITAIEKVEEVKGYIFINLIFSTDQKAHGKMKAKDYLKLLDFDGRNNLPSNSPKSLPYKRKSYDYIIGGVGLILFAIFYSIGSDDSSSKTKAATSKWNQADKGVMCRHYIGAQFGKSPNIIRTYNTNSSDLVYVKYSTAPNKEYRFACDVWSNTIVWYGWVGGKWGRERTEDRAKITKINQQQVSISGVGTVTLNN